MRDPFATFLCLICASPLLAQDNPASEIKAVTSRLKRLEEDVHREKLVAVKELQALEASYAKSIDALYKECLDDLNAMLDKETKAGRLDYVAELKEQFAEAEKSREINRRLPQSP